MQINTTARHCEIAPEVKLLAAERLERCTRYAPDLRDARLIVTAEKFRHTAEITVRLNQHEMVSREEAAEMRVAIDRALDGLESQLRRFKEKRVDRKREMRGNGAPEPSEAGEEIED